MESQISETGVGFDPAPVSFCKKTVTVVVRHSTKCKDKHRGGSWRKCRCPKALRVYEGQGPGKNRRVSAKNRSWQRAEKYAQEIRDSWDPEKLELRWLRAEKEQQRVRLEEGVDLFLADHIARLGDNSTVRNSRSLFGYINPETKTVISAGRLFQWVEQCNADRPAGQRITYISDFTSKRLTEWRASWSGNSDVTKHQRWSRVKGFFNFCKARGWIDDNPTCGIAAIKVAKGNRTAIFSDKQYAQILKAIPLSVPENVPNVTRNARQRRLMAFTELLRW